MSERQTDADQLSGYGCDDPTPQKDDSVENFTQKAAKVKGKKQGSAAKSKPGAKSSKTGKLGNAKETHQTSKVKKRMSDLKIEEQSGGGNSDKEETPAYVQQNSQNQPYDNIESQRSRNLIDNLVDEVPETDKEKKESDDDKDKKEETQEDKKEKPKHKKKVSRSRSEGSSKVASPHTSDSHSSALSMSNSEKSKSAHVTDTLADVADAWRNVGPRAPPP